MMRLSLLLFALSLALPLQAQVDQGRKNVPHFEPAFENQTRAPELPEAGGLKIETLAKGFDTAWGMALLPDTRILVSERPGRLNLVERTGKVTPLDGLPDVHVQGQGGLLDVALAEDFAQSSRIYLTYSKPKFPGRSTTALASAIFNHEEARLTDVTELFELSPPSGRGHHYGSRVIPHGGYLYLTLGDRAAPGRAQNLETGNGKVLRLMPDGSTPPDNPFNERGETAAQVYSYGHRNPQGADIHPETGALWILEHGPAGGDELNRITPGANYGWPITSYGENYDGSPVGRGRTSANGVEEPIYYWDPVIAPSDFTFYEGALFEGWEGDLLAGSLNPGGIVRLKFQGDRVIGEARLLEDLGRVRDIEIDHDGAILALAGGRGGQLLRITPAK